MLFCKLLLALLGLKLELPGWSSQAGAWEQEKLELGNEQRALKAGACEQGLNLFPLR
jgi:hypothetical protein